MGRICVARRLLAEFGVHLPAGPADIVARLREALDRAPAVLSHSLESVLEEIQDLESRLRQIDRQLSQITKRDPVAQRLLTIPGIGIITATAMIVGRPHPMSSAIVDFRKKSFHLRCPMM